MSALEEIHEFNHQAMETEFHLSIAGTNRKYAGQAAVNAFRELDIVEGFLSRYIEHSDIARINNLPAGESTIVDPITFNCLELALEINRATAGAFDVAYASRPARPLQKLFELDRSKYICRVFDAGVQIDLGAIGKGYALDCMAALLDDWGLKSLLLRASNSTVLAVDPPPDKVGWEAGFGPENDRRELLLKESALSGSGIAVQGAHIAGAEIRRGRVRYRAWTLASSGARSDALSTAFMIMKEADIRDYLLRNPSEKAWIQDDPEGPIKELCQAK